MFMSNASRKKSRFYNAFVFFCLFILVAGYQPLIFSKAESSFEESIYLDVNVSGPLPSYVDVIVRMELFSIKGLSTYTSVFMNEIYKKIEIDWGFSRYENTLYVGVVFDSSSLSSVEGGKIIADRIIERAENVWGIKLSYEGYNIKLYGIQGQDFNDTVYNYRAKEEHSLQKLRDILKQYCPVEGFGNILHSMTYWENVDIHLNLNLDEQCNPAWNMSVMIPYNRYFLVKPDQKYSVSLRNLTGYPEFIKSLPEASHSYLFLSVYDTLYEYVLKAQPLPQDMRAGWEFDYFQQDIKGGSVDDLGIIFSYVKPSTERSFITLICEFGVFLAVLIVVSIFIERIRTRSERKFLKMQQKLKKSNL